MKSKEIINCGKNFSKEMKDFSLQQIKCYALFVEHLQPLFNKNIDWENIKSEVIRKNVPFDNKNDLFPIMIDLKKIDLNRNRERAIQEIDNLIHQYIPMPDEEGKKRVRFFLAQKTYFDEKGNLWVCLTVASVRWVMELGSKLDYLSFHIPSLMRLSTAYSSRMFLLLSQWYSARKIEMSFDEIKKSLGCFSDYTPFDFSKRVLKASSKELERKESILQFKWKFKSEDKKKGKGRKLNNIVIIKIFDMRNEEEVFDYIENEF